MLYWHNKIIEIIRNIIKNSPIRINGNLESQEQNSIDFERNHQGFMGETNPQINPHHTLNKSKFDLENQWRPSMKSALNLREQLERTLRELWFNWVKL